jgi:serine/threonine protein kinase
VLIGTSLHTDAEPKPGDRVTAPPIDAVAAAFPQLEQLEWLGTGGMGVVYKARQTRLDRWVALKLLPWAQSADPTFAERFHREARFLARLNHPNIVQVYDFGQAGGFCYLLMEYVDGVNLRQAMQAGRFSSKEALILVPSLCSALQYAHEQGVLHRDIKPENILLDAQGRVKLADFGIAKVMNDPASGRADITLTQSGARLGTPHYMAPEQIEKPSEVDHRADIYSLGVVFYELLTGELPLGRFAAPSEKTNLDARIDAIVLRALAKERELRQQSAGEVKTQVEGVTSTPPPSAGQASNAPTSPHSSSASSSPTAVIHDSPRTDLPAWVTRFAWILTGYILVRLIQPHLFPSGPTTFGRTFVWPVDLLLIPTLISIRMRRIEWRYLALISAALLFASQVGSMVSSLLQYSGGSAMLGGISGFSFPGWIFSILTSIPPIACFWLLNRRDLIPALESASQTGAAAYGSIWPHRVFWVITGFFVLPFAAVLATLFVPILHRAGFTTSAGLLAGFVPALAGILGFLGFWRTRPGAAGAPTPESSRIWSHRAFWLLAGGILLVSCLAGVGLLVSRLVQAHQHLPLVGVILMPWILLGWLLWGYASTRPTRTRNSAADSTVSTLEQRRFRILCGGTVGAMGLLLISGVLALRDATPPPPLPISMASPGAPGSDRLEVTRTQSRKEGSRLFAEWELSSPFPAEARIAFRGQSISRPLALQDTGALGAMPPSRYTAKVSVTYSTLDPNKRSVLLSVNLGEKTFSAPLRGGTPADTILDEAGKQLVTQLSCQFGSTVWIAFGETEQITLTFLPINTPNGPVGNLPESLPAGTPSPAAEKWHNAWIQWSEDQQKAAVGVIAPEGVEILASRRALEAAEAEFRGRPLDKAEANARYTKAVHAILERKAMFGAASSAEVRDSAAAWRDAERERAEAFRAATQSTSRPSP